MWSTEDLSSCTYILSFAQQLLCEFVAVSHFFPQTWGHVIMELNSAVSTLIIVGVQPVLNLKGRADHFTWRMTHLQRSGLSGWMHKHRFRLPVSDTVRRTLQWSKKPCRLIKKLRLLKKKQTEKILRKVQSSKNTLQLAVCVCLCVRVWNKKVMWLSQHFFMYMKQCYVDHMTNIRSRPPVNGVEGIKHYHPSLNAIFLHDGRAAHLSVCVCPASSETPAGWGWSTVAHF